MRLKHSVAIVQRMSVESLSLFSRPATVWRFPGKSILVAVLAVAASLWLFWDGLSRMYAWWIDVPEYSHGLLIPPVAAFLMWQQKDRLERMEFLGSWWGVAVVLLGGLFLLLGQVSAIYSIVQYAYLVTLCGMVLSFTGAKPFRLLAMPFLILLFMVPLPQFVFANISLRLQLLSSEIGVFVIRLFDISVLREGNIIDLGGYKLEVAEACDGLRYLFPLMTIAFLMSYFYRGAVWKRVFLFLSSIPITVLMNSLRIGTIGVMVEHWGIGMAEGFLHEFQGWAVFMASAGLMIGEIALLTRLGRESGTWRQLFGVEFPMPSPPDARIERRDVPNAFFASLALLAIFMAVYVLVPRPVEIRPARATFNDFPMELGSWVGRRESMEGVYMDVLKLDDYLLADYTDGNGPQINAYMTYYYSQLKGEAFHSPRWCLPGGGWQVLDYRVYKVGDVKIDGRLLRVNRTLMQLGNERQVVYYWFQQRGRLITDEFVVKWYLFWDAITRHRTDGGLVRLIVMLPSGVPEAEADRRLTEFASKMAPVLTRYVPD
jgi:exosortase D (VPLPA-CTERM-specific)